MGKDKGKSKEKGKKGHTKSSGKKSKGGKRTKPQKSKGDKRKGNGAAKVKKQFEGESVSKTVQPEQPQTEQKFGTKIKKKLEQKQTKKQWSATPALNLDPKLMNKNHQKRDKSWQKDATGMPATAEETARTLLRVSESGPRDRKRSARYWRT